MRLARGLLIVAYGLFTIAAQTLLFREFITAFEGNDISVGIFFGSWFLWVGLGAVLVRRWDRLTESLLHHIELLFLLYVPAFAAQLLLITYVRELAGVASYDLMSVQTVVLWALVVNAPVSLITGMVFPVACRWIEQARAFAVSRVYILEAVGSFAGGLAVTVLLAWHVHPVRVFLVLAVGLLSAVFIVSLAARRKAALAISLTLAVVLAAIALAGIDGRLAQRLQVLKWGKLLPREAFTGAFHTAQAEYLYGRQGGQWIVMRDGGVCEVLPNEEDSGRTAAIALCQNPQARRVLVVGSSLAVCRRFLTLPQVEEVAWTHPDPEYVRRLPEFVPREFAVNDKRFRPVADEVRRSLKDAADRFDIVVITLADTGSLAFNRYYTLEFYEQAKTSLRTGGVLAVSIAGGENVVGAELAGLGASVRMTMSKVFPNLVLVPGEQTWLIASEGEALTGDPAILRDRFAAIEGAQEIFPPTGLLSVYLPDRAVQTLQAYEKVDLQGQLLVNRDARPLTHLYGLLLAARQSGASVTRFVKLLAVGGWLPFIVPVLVFAALRVWAMARREGGGSASSFDNTFLVFSTGWVSIAMVIILMYLYETHFGSLYLHIGVISSLFMVGLTAGALATRRVIGAVREEGTADPHRLRMLLVVILSIHAVVLAALALGSVGKWPVNPGHGLFALAFVLSGLCCGGYWPLAAAQLAAGSFHPGEAGSRLETADHLGACVGGLATSLLMVPVLGIQVSLLVLIGLVLANVPASMAALRKRDPRIATREQLGLRQAGYVLFGACLCVVLCSNLLARAGARLQPSLPDYAVQALAGESPVRQASAPLDDGARRANYFTIMDEQQQSDGYLFSSVDFAPDVRGFGGRFNLAVRVDASGALVDFFVVRSNETPSYLDLLAWWLDSLKGKALFDREPFAGVDSVSGATVSSEAIVEALQESGRRFAADVLGRMPLVGDASVEAARSRPAYLPNAAALYLIAAFVLAFIVSHRGGFRSRLVALVLTFIAGGIVLNAQYSSEQIATLMSFDAPVVKLSGVFLLVVGVPVVVLLFGNLYCGYVCPFGAAQELLGYVVPRRFRPDPSRGEMRAARFVKYVVLVVLVVAFFVSLDRRTLAGDPLSSVFGLRSGLSNWPAWMWGVAAMALVGSLFYRRFWCRYLCPVGAFLSLLNHARPLRRLVPAKWFGKCEFGLTASDHLDCLYCDRCRHPATQAGTASSGKSERAPFARPLVFGAVLVGLFVASLAVSQFRQVMPLILEEPVATVGAGGEPRDVDVKQIRTLIDQGRLSDRKAEHYREIE